VVFGEPESDIEAGVLSANTCTEDVTVVPNPASAVVDEEHAHVVGPGATIPPDPG
jgi:hypothetical protein